MELITPEPVILVEHCDDGNFNTHPDGLDALRRIRASGIKVICIAGQYRQGKSYLANKLMCQQSGFGVGHTVAGKTRGVWMWAADGGEGGEALVVLDTEGLDDPGHPDCGATLNTKLFTMAVLLSSELLLNTQSVIGQIDELSCFVTDCFVTELAKQIHAGDVKRHMKLTEFFPKLCRVVRDYVKKCLSDLEVSGVGPAAMAAESENQIRQVIRQAFPSITGSKVSYLNPEDDDDLVEMDGKDTAREEAHLDKSFLDDIAVVVMETFASAPLKKLGASSLDGSSLATWVENVVTSINKNMMDMPDAIESLIAQEMRDVVDEALEAYVSIMDQVPLPANAETYETYDTIHKHGLDAACSICEAHPMVRVTKAALSQVHRFVMRRREEEEMRRREMEEMRRREEEEMRYTPIFECGAAAGPRFDFSSMEGVGKKKAFASFSKKWMVLRPGLGIGSTCTNASCAQYGHFVICNLGMTTFNVGMDFDDDVKCPTCNQMPSDKNTRTYFSKCKWSFKGRRADGKKMEGAPTDTGPEGYVEMPGGEDGQATWKFLEITTVPR